MSCYKPCVPCQPCGPTSLANSCKEPCVRQCQASTVVIDPSPMLVALPAVGRTLSCEGVSINSDCCDLSRFSSLYCGRRGPPC